MSLDPISLEIGKTVGGVSSVISLTHCSCLWAMYVTNCLKLGCILVYGLHFLTWLIFSLNNSAELIVLTLCHLKYVAWLKYGICSQPQKHCRWRGCLIACRVGCFNCRWHQDIVKLFYLFLWGGTLSYVGIGTVLL